MKKTVVQLIPSFHQGGSERQALQLCRLLADDATYNVKLACLERRGVLLDAEVTETFGTVPEFPLTSFYDANMARQLKHFVAYLRSNKVDIVQTHDFYTNIFGMLGAKVAGIPVRIAAKRETGLRTSVQQFIERRAFGAAGAVIVNSETVRRYLSRAGVPKRKLRLVYNGIDQGRFSERPGEREASLHELGLPASGEFRYVTMVANLRERVKNHEMFLRAAVRVTQEVKGSAFVVAGEGERLRLITSMARRLGLQDRISFLGRCNRVPDLLSLSEIGVLTSDSEGFSNSILEYMAAGLPVVATDVGGAAEAVVEGQSGFLVPPNDDGELAARLIGLLNDRELSRRLGRNGRRRVAEKFSTEAQLANTLAVYESELARVPSFAI